MRDVGGDVQYLAGTDHELLRAIGANPEAERTLNYVGDLLVLVCVLRYQAAFLEIDVRQHDAIAGDQASVELVAHLFFRHVVPAVERAFAIRHWNGSGFRVDVRRGGSDSSHRALVAATRYLV